MSEGNVAAVGTRFAQIEIKRRIYPVGGGTVRLIQEIGWAAPRATASPAMS